MKWFARFRVRGMNRRITRLTVKTTHDKELWAKQQVGAKYTRLRERLSRMISRRNKFAEKRGVSVDGDNNLINQ